VARYKISELKNAVDLIKEFEGLYLKAYLDPVGIPTIGWGTIRYPDDSPVKIGDVISKERADTLLEYEVTKFINWVDQLVKVPVNPNQFGALVSFAYNVGADIDTDVIAEGLGDSTLLKKLNAGDYNGASLEFAKWNKAGGKVLKGLVRRREAERKLFVTPAAGGNPVVDTKEPEIETPNWFEPFKKWILALVDAVFGKKGESSAVAEPPPDDLASMILKQNPTISRAALLYSLKFKDHEKVKNKKYLSILDANKPDYQSRFHFIDMKTFVSRNELAAHGSGSDKNKDNIAESFSNVPGSYQSSLGPMVFAENYVSGKKKTGDRSAFQISRRIDGLIKGLNDKVRARAIVFHDGFYVTPERAKIKSVGDSQGCIVLYYPVIKEINPLVEGSLLVIYHSSLES
jgi:lysozyme